MSSSTAATPGATWPRFAGMSPEAPHLLLPTYQLVHTPPYMYRHMLAAAAPKPTPEPTRFACCQLLVQSKTDTKAFQVNPVRIQLVIDAAKQLLPRYHEQQHPRREQAHPAPEAPG